MKCIWPLIVPLALVFAFHSSAISIGYESSEGYIVNDLDGQPAGGGTSWQLTSGTDQALKVNGTAGDTDSATVTDWGIQNAARTNSTPCVYQYTPTDTSLGGKFLPDSSELSYHLRFNFSTTPSASTDSLFVLTLGQDDANHIALKVQVDHDGGLSFFYHDGAATVQIDVKDKSGNDFVFSGNNINRFVTLQGRLDYATQHFTLIVDDVVQVFNDGSIFFPFVSSSVDTTSPIIYPHITLEDNATPASGITYKLDDCRLDHVRTRFVVATNGSDSNPGTQASPKATLAGALAQAAAGDTVTFRAGSYASADMVIFDYNVGTVADPVTINVWPGESVLVDPSLGNGAGNNGMGFLGCSNLIVDGFEVTGTGAIPSWGLFIGSSENITVQNCHIHGSANAAVHIGKASKDSTNNDYTTASKNIRFFNNRVEGNPNNTTSSGEGIYVGTGSYATWDSANQIYIRTWHPEFPDDSSDVILRGNQVYSCSSEPINVKSEAHNVTSEYNHIYDSELQGAAGGIHYESIQNNTPGIALPGDTGTPYSGQPETSNRGHVVRYNVIHDITKDPNRTATTAVGIAIDGPQTAVYGNLCYNIEERGLYIGSWNQLDNLQQIDVFHNTMFGNGNGNGLWPDIYISNVLVSSQFKNNIGNLLSQSSFSYPNNLSAVASDFLDPNNTDSAKANFQLASTSAAINNSISATQDSIIANGVHKQEVPLDFYRHIRPVGTHPDMGAYEYVALDSNLKGWWPLDQSVGELVFDYTTNNHRGIINGLRSSNGFHPGRVGNARLFNKTHVSIPYHSDLNHSTFTATAWAKVLGGKDTQRVVLASRSTSGATGFAVFASANNNPNVWHAMIGTGSTWKYLSNSANGKVAVGQWVHLALVYDPTESTPGKLYVNGVSSGTSSSTYAPNSDATSSLYIGTLDANGSRSFDGLIDDVRIYDRALSQAEIQALMAPQDLAEEFTDPAFNDTTLPGNWTAGDGYGNALPTLTQSDTRLAIVSQNTASPAVDQRVHLVKTSPSIDPSNAKRITQALTFAGPWESNMPLNDSTSKPYIRLILNNSTATDQTWNHGNRTYLGVHLHHYGTGLYCQLMTQDAYQSLSSAATTISSNYAPDEGDQIIAIYTPSVVEKVFLRKARSGQEIVLFENETHNINWSNWTNAYTHLDIGNNAGSKDVISTISIDRVTTTVD